MKAILLAAGKGNRLFPLTSDIPKPLIKIAGKSLIEYIIEELVESGISEIGIVVGYLKEKIMDYLGNGSKFKANITYFKQKKYLGTADALLSAERFVRHEPFLLYLADTIIQDELKNFVKNSLNFNKGNLMMVSSVPKNKLKQTGLVHVKKNQIVRLREKSTSLKTNLAISGVYFFNSKHLFSTLKNLSPGKQNEKQITDVIQLLIDKGEKVYPYKTRKTFLDAGDFNELLKVNKFLLSKQNKKITIAKRTRIHKSAKLHDSIQIGNNCIINKNVEIGPYVSIGNNSKILNGIIKNSIIMDSCKINVNGIVENSIIGNDIVILMKNKTKFSGILSSKSIIKTSV